MYWWKVAVLKGPLELRRCLFLCFSLGFFKSGLRSFWCIHSWVSKNIDLVNDFTYLQFFVWGSENWILHLLGPRPIWRNTAGILSVPTIDHVMKLPDMFNCSDLFEIIQYKVFTKNYEVPLYGSNNMWFNYHT